MMTDREKECSIPGCEHKPVGKGWCSMHWQRWKAHGDPLTKVGNQGRSVIERFKDLVRFDDITGCWLWQGERGQGGRYGRFYADGKRWLAHRWAYEHFVGPISEGMQLDHFACDNPPCVNPTHVRPVTPRENALRGNSFVAWNTAKVKCKRGHEDFRVNAAGNRECRACRSAGKKVPM